MADAAPGHTAPCDVPPPDIDPELLARLSADPLAERLGITLEQVRPGYARAVMPVGPELLNAVGTAHGGATMALLDVVHAAVSNSHGTVAVAQDVHTEFLAPGREGDRLTTAGWSPPRLRASSAPTGRGWPRDRLPGAHDAGAAGLGRRAGTARGLAGG